VELARALPPGAVDLILGAHTHFALNRDGLEPTNRVNDIPIAHAGAFGEYLGEVTLEIAEAGARVTAACLLRVAELPENPAFEVAHVRPLVDQTQALMREPLGNVDAHADLTDEAVRAAFTGQESALVNFVADALAARCRRAGIPVDFAMVDASVISAGLPAGRVTLGDLYRLAPFADSIVTFRLPHGELQAFLDDNARRALLPAERREERGFAHFSQEVRYTITGARAVEGTLRGEPASRLTGREPLLIACGSFARVPARAWEQAMTAAGVRIFDVHALAPSQTGLPLRAELAGHIKKNGAQDSTGLRRDGRVSRRP
jgi:5'-nucleotidase/5'-nucleotidase/UDP-sugar diphosphatase